MTALEFRQAAARRGGVVLLLITALAARAALAQDANVNANANAGAGRDAGEIISIAAIDGRQMQARVLMPAGPGPFPLAVISHGSPVSRAERQAMQVPVFRSATNWLLGQGYMVVLPLRRGYGAGGGAWVEGYGSCSDPDFYKAGLATAQDIDATLTAMRSRAEARADRILLVGVSAGGWGSIAEASRNPRGVFAVLDFAGGRGGKQPIVGNCNPAHLVQAAGRYGATTHIPSLWLYAANDQFFAPELSHRMFDAYVKAGGDAQYVALPSFGRDGHLAFARAEGLALWRDAAETFLARFNR